MAKNDFTVRVEGGERLIRKLQQLGLDVSAALEISAHAGMEVIHRTADSYAPADMLERETVTRRKNLVEVDMGPPEEKWYWQFLETGTQPHEITPSTASLLVFDGDKGVIRTASVQHPGMEARPFMQPAFDEEKGQAEKEFGQTMKNRALR